TSSGSASARKRISRSSRPASTGLGTKRRRSRRLGLSRRRDRLVIEGLIEKRQHIRQIVANAAGEREAVTLVRDEDQSDGHPCPAQRSGQGDRLGCGVGVVVSALEDQERWIIR